MQQAEAMENPLEPYSGRPLCGRSDAASLDRRYQQTGSHPSLVYFPGNRCSWATVERAWSPETEALRVGAPTILHNPPLLHMIEPKFQQHCTTFSRSENVGNSRTELPGCERTRDLEWKALGRKIVSLRHLASNSPNDG